MSKISVFIITKNEENRIGAAIKSVKNIADEIIIIDSGSTDSTIKISEELGARVVYNAWPGYLKQKIYGQNLCRNNWILNIDSDEELSQDLQDEIGYIFSGNLQDHYYAYKIKLTIVHRNKPKLHFLAPVNKAIRLYNKNFCGFNENSLDTHDSVTFNPGIYSENKIYILNEIAYHKSGSSITQLVEKANFYSGLQAQDLINSKRKITNLRIFCEIFTAFFKAFFIRRYFIFGFSGFIDSVIFAFARFLRLAKVRESNINLTRNE